MKKTIGLSVLLHLCLFTAALLWSAQLFERGGERPGGKVLFVRLMGEKQTEVGEQIVALSTPVSIKASRLLPDLKEPESQEPRMSREELLRIFHDPKLPVEDTSWVESDDSEITGFDTSEAAEPISVDADIVLRAVEGKDNAVNGWQDGRSPYKDTMVRPDRYEDVYGTGITGGSVPADVIETIRNAIERFKTYPLAARRRGTEGVVHVSFSITPEGKPDQVRIVRSSGSRLLDRATIDTVKRASPYPYVNASLEVPVMYRLEE
jgi:TonB family protein